MAVERCKDTLHVIKLGYLQDRCLMEKACGAVVQGSGLALDGVVKLHRDDRPLPWKTKARDGGIRYFVLLLTDRCQSDTLLPLRH